MALTSPPSADQLAFLPHPPRPLSRTPPASYIHLPGASSPSRARSTTLTSTARPDTPSKSAPTSPLSRPSHRGITPLSSISSIYLTSPPPQPHQAIQHADSHYRPSQSLPIVPQHAQLFSQSAGPSRQPKYPPSTLPRSKSRQRPLSSSSSSETETETEVDSDSTFVPGRPRHSHSLSQPDLTALRSRLEGWAGGVAQSTRATPPTHPIPIRPARTLKTPPTRQASLPTSKTPPVRPASLPTSSQPTFRPPTSRSKPSSSSPRSPLVSPLTPVQSSTLIHPPSPHSYPFPTNPKPAEIQGGDTSEEADDDLSSSISSPSSGSLTFSPKRHRYHSNGSSTSASGLLRRRVASTDRLDRVNGTTTSGLGLSLLPPLHPATSSQVSISPPQSLNTDSQATPDNPLLPEALNRLFQHSSLLSLRLLAVVPAAWGICVLLQGLVTGGLWVDVWPWGVDLSREALERLVVGEEGIGGREWREGSRGDIVLCIAWAICTAHFCFTLTTGLTHRWRSYYSLPSTLTRLLSLQCLCWPATYLTLRFLGANRPLLAWVVIGVTTGWSRTVQMWVTSNVVARLSVSSGDIPGYAQVQGGDITPGRSKKRLPSDRDLPRAKSGKVGEEEEGEEGEMGWWESFLVDRRWDWDEIAREVGWKVGGLLLVTCGWLFWGIESGRVERGGVW